MKLAFRPFTTACGVRWAIALALVGSICGFRPAYAQDEEMRDPTRVQGMLRALDKNSDGQLSPDELANSRSARNVRMLARKANLNPDGTMAISALVGAVGKTETKPSSAPAAATPSPSFGSGGGTASLDYIERAEKLIKENDKNNNGVLDGDEAKSVPSKYKSADLNGDGTLTRDEIVAKISEINSKLGNVSSAVAPAPPPTFGGPGASTGGPGGPGRPGSGGPGPGGSGPGGPGPGGSGRSEGRGRFPGGDRPGGGNSGGPPYGGNQGQSRMRRPGEAGPDVVPGQRKSFRVKSATERFPKGLPDWFARSDVDGDGQVSMAEYSVTWNEAKAQEYAKLDTNDDGFVTVAEAMASANGGRRPTFATATAPGTAPTPPAPTPSGAAPTAPSTATPPSPGNAAAAPPAGAPQAGSTPTTTAPATSAAPMPAGNSPMPSPASGSPPSNTPPTNTPAAGGTPLPMPQGPSPSAPPAPGFGSPQPSERQQ